MRFFDKLLENKQVEKEGGENSYFDCQKWLPALFEEERIGKIEVTAQVSFIESERALNRPAPLIKPKESLLHNLATRVIELRH